MRQRWMITLQADLQDVYNELQSLPAEGYVVTVDLAIIIVQTHQPCPYRLMI